MGDCRSHLRIFGDCSNVFGPPREDLARGLKFDINLCDGTFG